MLDRDYPDAALVSEWSNPYQAICLGRFHMDFYLDHHGNGYNTLLRDYETPGGDRSFFRRDSGGDILRFLNDYLPKYEVSKDHGFISMFTCNHDTPRPAATLSPDELKLAYAFILTMPGVPFIYYGDEIGMKYLDLPTKEGGYQRTGSRSPMQWDGTANRGFSSAGPDRIYLPVDSSPDAPDVERQLPDPGSLLNETRRLIALRKTHADLLASSPFSVIHAEECGYPFVYGRGSLILSVNPSSDDATFSDASLSGRKIVYSIGDVSLEGGSLTMGPQSFAVLA